MPKDEILSPAALAARRFGGVRKLGRLLGDETRVGQWISRGGKIPNGDDGQKRVLELAKKHRVQLTAEEVIYGGRL